MIGKRFGRWKVIAPSYIKNASRYWLCKCDCGNTKIVCGNSLRRGHSQSCGCLLREMLTSHGFTNSPTYTSWQNMKARCFNKKNGCYKNYGKRGISVCKTWLKFENFLANMGKRPRGHSLERIDNNKGYCRSNCKWATRREQNSNKRTNIMVTIKGKTKPLHHWSDFFGLSRGTVNSRINRGGWDPVEALTTPIRK